LKMSCVASSRVGVAMLTFNFTIRPVVEVSVK